MTKPTDTFQNWKKSKGKLLGLKALGKPPKAANPSLYSQLSKQATKITLPKVWKSHDHVEHEPQPRQERNSKAQAGAEPLERPGARRSHPPYDWKDDIE